jgi:uncharacterized coiled-coil DUF342 family protein
LEFERLNQALGNNEEIWNEFNQLSNETYAKIGELFKQSAEEHRLMRECYSKSNEARQEKKGFLADKYSKEGFEHRDKRDAINEEIAELKRIKYEAKEQAKLKVKTIDSEELQDAKDLMDHWREKFNIEKEKMAALKAECEELHEIALKAQAEYERRMEADAAANKPIEPSQKADTLYSKQDEEQALLMKEYAEIMQTLKECNEKESQFKKESAIYKRKVKNNWTLDRAGVSWNDRRKAK